MKTRTAGLFGFLILIAGGAIAYERMDLREPQYTRRVLDGFRRGDPWAWDAFKMDPPRSSRAIPALLEGLRDSNPTVRERAVVGVCGLPLTDQVRSELKALGDRSDLQDGVQARHCIGDWKVRAWPRNWGVS